MRILLVNDGIGDPGGVQAYLDAVVPLLLARGHALAVAYCTESGGETAAGPLGRLPRFPVGGSSAEGAFAAIHRWAPDVCFSHNMRELSVERRLARLAPVVKFLHGYAGTCIGGQKTHRFPEAEACSRLFGPACVALYLPRRCGRLNPLDLVRDLRWACDQQDLFAGYAAVVVASEHMWREYASNGIAESRLHLNPLFATLPAKRVDSPVPAEPRVGFLGRMVRLKGGDVLIHAAHHAAQRLGRGVALTMMGDGPQRAEWEALATRLGVPCMFTGWIWGDRRWDLLGGCSALALPSILPEPFGLVGLEGGALGVPAIAADVGGVREWLREGVNGVLVPSPVRAEAFGDAMARLLGDRETQRVLRTGARRVATDMSAARHVDRLEPVLRHVWRAALAS